MIRKIERFRHSILAFLIIVADISTWLVQVVWRSIISSRHGEIAPPTRGLSCNRARSPVTRGVSARFVIEERSAGETDRMEKSLDCRSRGLADLFVRTIRLCTTNIVHGDDWKSRSYNFWFFEMKKIKWNSTLPIFLKMDPSEIRGASISLDLELEYFGFGQWLKRKRSNGISIF